METTHIKEVKASPHDGTRRSDVRDLHLVEDEDLGLLRELFAQSFQRVARRRRPPVLALALRPRVVEPPMDLQHELVEVDAPLLVALEALEKQIAAQGLAAADVAVHIQSFRDPRLARRVDLVFGLIEDSI